MKKLQQKSKGNGRYKHPLENTLVKNHQKVESKANSVKNTREMYAYIQTLTQYCYM